jgi:hypothetical protein
MKNAVFWDVMPLTLVRTDVSGERIGVKRFRDLGPTIAVTNNGSTPRSEEIVLRVSMVP